ncbi:hypothetical protein AVEN_142959-1 [Araneus ventricosus]|uniref:Uncharacterized protein n=1 Tax=Araneus ventricosus TaxID=182803 RepID=A0A4Y2M798_ARAVE|nr:hypothetical protein AVEN_142959-1 [Araneus ventricosus]
MDRPSPCQSPPRTFSLTASLHLITIGPQPLSEPPVINLFPMDVQSTTAGFKTNCLGGLAEETACVFRKLPLDLGAKDMNKSFPPFKVTAYTVCRTAIALEFPTPLRITLRPAATGFVLDREMAQRNDDSHPTIINGWVRDFTVDITFKCP